MDRPPTSNFGGPPPVPLGLRLWLVLLHDLQNCISIFSLLSINTMFVPKRISFLQKQATENKILGYI